MGDIFWLDIGFEDNPNESKIRPAIIIDKSDDHFLLLVSTTSVPPSDPPKKFDQFKIPILNWRRSGLLKPSWVLGLRLINLTSEQLKSLIKEEDFIGRLNEQDFNYIISEVQRMHIR